MYGTHERAHGIIVRTSRPLATLEFCNGNSLLMYGRTRRFKYSFRDASRCYLRVDVRLFQFDLRSLTIASDRFAVCAIDYNKTKKMAWPPNTTTTTKQNAKSSMYIEYSNLINELKQYMPQFNASVKDLQEPSQTFVTNFYTDVFSEFFCDVNNLIEVRLSVF